MTSPQRESSASRDLALDGVRALACLMVYFYHTGANLSIGPVRVPGYVGVVIFFVLSGYLMFGPFAQALTGERPFPNGKSYLFRRFSRIYPPYLVSLIAYTGARYLVAWFHLAKTRSAPPGVANLTTHALLIFNYFDRKDFYSICGVFWSLAIEFQFYLVLPVACALALRLGTRTRRGVWLFLLAFAAIGPISRALEVAYFQRAGLATDLPRFVTVFSYLDLFAGGMALAHATSLPAKRRLILPSAARWGLLLTGVVGTVLCASWALHVAPRASWQTAPDLLFTLGYPALSSLSAAILIMGVVTRPSAGAGPLTWPPLVWLGEISYSLYLYHILAQFLVLSIVVPERRLPPGWLAIGSSLIALLPTLVLSAAMFYLVELPCLRWGRRYSQHRGAQPILDPAPSAAEAGSATRPAAPVEVEVAPPAAS